MPEPPRPWAGFTDDQGISRINPRVAKKRFPRLRWLLEMRAGGGRAADAVRSAGKAFHTRIPAGGGGKRTGPGLRGLRLIVFFDPAKLKAINDGLIVPGPKEDLRLRPAVANAVGVHPATIDRLRAKGKIAPTFKEVFANGKRIKRAHFSISATRKALADHWPGPRGRRGIKPSAPAGQIRPGRAARRFGFLRGRMLHWEMHDCPFLGKPLTVERHFGRKFYVVVELKEAKRVSGLLARSARGVVERDGDLWYTLLAAKKKFGVSGMTLQAWAERDWVETRQEDRTSFGSNQKTTYYRFDGDGGFKRLLALKRKNGPGRFVPRVLAKALDVEAGSRQTSAGPASSAIAPEAAPRYEERTLRIGAWEHKLFSRAPLEQGIVLSFLQTSNWPDWVEDPLPPFKLGPTLYSLRAKLRSCGAPIEIGQKKKNGKIGIYWVLKK